MESYDRDNHKCYWVHCVYGCDLSCNHEELCFQSEVDSKNQPVVD